ncbi:DNA polymerase-1 [Antricoccus suffuscus]|uniref:5'-3' exonuclease n=2 Tax=Antricoccus suffuscus TaxID=1629062 RepID=A0A2T0ZWW3_9ACTN|nr:DNA polymerase-1 [Antricoccus suffuscus]
MRTSDGRASWAVHGFTSLLIGAVTRAGADALVIGFDDHTTSVRKDAHPSYKATRLEKPPELVAQIAGTISMLRDAGICVVVPDGLEADDVLASASRAGCAAGWRVVIATSDRDSFALINEHTSVLRLLNGGIAGSPVLTPDRLHTMYGVRPEQYRDYAAMRGDASDNLKGIPGIGKKTAQKLLARYGSTQAAFDAVDADPGGVGATLGRAMATKLADATNRAAFATTSKIMTMRTDVPLGLDFDDADGLGRLPLSPDLLIPALDSWELTGLQESALRTLGGFAAVSRTQVDPYANLQFPVAEPPDHSDDATGLPTSSTTVTAQPRRSEPADQLELTLF